MSYQDEDCDRHERARIRKKRYDNNEMNDHEAAVFEGMSNYMMRNVNTTDQEFEELAHAAEEHHKNFGQELRLRAQYLRDLARTLRQLCPQGEESSSAEVPTDTSASKYTRLPPSWSHDDFWDWRDGECSDEKIDELWGFQALLHENTLRIGLREYDDELYHGTRGYTRDFELADTSSGQPGYWDYRRTLTDTRGEYERREHPYKPLSITIEKQTLLPYFRE